MINEWYLLAGQTNKVPPTQRILISARCFSAGRVFSPIWFTLALALILLLAFGLRLWNLGAQSLWHDEAWSVFSAYHPLAWGELGTDPNAPPVFYLTLSAWLHLAGDGVWAMRYWSLLTGVITVAITALVTRRFFGMGAALLAAFLVAVSPILWVYSQEIRGYVAMPLYGLLLLAFADQLLRAPSRRIWVWLALVETLALYTQNLAVPLVAWLNCAVIAGWLWKHEWRHLRTWLAVQIGLGIVYLPWLLTQSPTGTPLNNPPPIAPTVIWDIWQSYFTGIKTLLDADSGLTVLLVVFGLVTLIALIGALVWRKSARIYWLLSQVVLLPIFELGIIWAAHIDFHPRYFILGVPATLILIAVGLGEWAKQISRALRKVGWAIEIQGWASRSPYVIPVSAALLAGVITVQMLHVTFSSPIYQHDDFRAIAEHYAQLGADSAIVIPYGWEPTLDYYSQKMGFKAQIVGIPLGSSWQTIVDRLNAIHARHIEVLTWYQLPADLRGAYPCLLGAATQNLPNTYTVNGLTTTEYDQPGTIQVQQVDSSDSNLPAPFGNTTLTRAYIAFNSRRICTITEWTLSQKADHPLRTKSAILNIDGWEIAHADGDIRDDHQTPAPFWSSGTTGTGLTLLNYPTGLQDGYYNLLVSIYDAVSQHNLDLIINGAPSGPLIAIAGLTDANIGKIDTDLAAPPANALPLAAGWQVVESDNATDSNDVCTLQPGQEYRVTALWWHDPPPDRTVSLRLTGSDWQLEYGQLILFPTTRKATLAWTGFTIPAQANGTAQLAAILQGYPQPIPIKTCTIKPSDHLFSPPAIQTPVNVDFQGVGTLAGFALDNTSVSHAGTFNMTLYWKAATTPTIAYTVFVHLLNSAGQVIAQSDSPPDNGSRPTTGWVKDEYIVDPHTLTFNVAGQNYTGATTIEVGLYDPNSGQRVLLSNGADHMLLPVALTVK